LILIFLDDVIISSPFNFQQKIHVDFDSTTGLVGLPPEWDAKLLSSGLSKQEVTANSAAVVEVMDFLDRKEKQDQQKALGIITTDTKPTSNSNNSNTAFHKDPALAEMMAKAAEMGVALPADKAKETQLSDLVNAVDNPNEIYEDHVKVGEGYDFSFFLNFFVLKLIQ
jgi:hypothetical protein